MTIFYYPTLLSFVASTLAYVIDPSLASSGVFTAVVIIVVYWAGVLLALRGGIGVIAKLASSGVLVGTLIPGVLLVMLGIVFLLQGNPSAAPMGGSHIFPAWTGIVSIVLIVSNFGAYSGMEMNAVHVNELEKPERQFPRAMFLAGGMVESIGHLALRRRGGARGRMGSHRTQSQITAGGPVAISTTYLRRRAHRKSDDEPGLRGAELRPGALVAKRPRVQCRHCGNPDAASGNRNLWLHPAGWPDG
ncbi:putative amino acid transporter [Gordonia effusa NBRC 100432]|uniref:Putative amino acid transporter n=1 Tax=Gordonia effusa NBRC 100432 TaxID=1077974 RepID=H0QXA3_9ACTN|nr:putative amino acid transporter [Gordonia effusa NBRC 100432]